MKEFTIPLVKEKDGFLPIIDYHDIPVLVDTGAVIPVFSIMPEILSRNLGAKRLSKDKSISGFGGKARGDIYCLPKFEFGKMKFKNLEIFIPYKFIIKNIPIILSASMFHKTYYGFDTINGKFVVKMDNAQSYEREFKIGEGRNGELYPILNGVMVQSFDCNFQSLVICDKIGKKLNRKIQSKKKKIHHCNDLTDFHR